MNSRNAQRSISFLIVVAATMIAWKPSNAQETWPVHDEQSEVIESGLLIVEGEFIPAPYVFNSNDQGIFVNQVPLDITSLGLTESDFYRWDMVPPQEEGELSDPVEVRFRRTAIQPQSPWKHIINGLLSGEVVVVSKSERPQRLLSTKGGLSLVKLLLDDARRATVSTAMLGEFGDVNKAMWAQWIQDFRPSPEFRSRATSIIDRIENIEKANKAAIHANLRFEASSYPLTVIGMALIVLAFGHLLSYRPSMDSQSAPAPLSVKEQRAVAHCLILIIFLSALDLVWTLLAHQAGAMKELNPIGASIIDNPELLILFKLVATLIGTGLLFGTREFAVARRASWYCCLTCTLLAARWVSINSVSV